MEMTKKIIKKSSLMLITLLKALKPKQLTAVQHSEGPLLIIAGTRKTTTITAKIAHMVEKGGIPPEYILALTFSKDAARNMERKVGDCLVKIGMSRYAHSIHYVQSRSAARGGGGASHRHR